VQRRAQGRLLGLRRSALLVLIAAMSALAPRRPAAARASVAPPESGFGPFRRQASLSVWAHGLCSLGATFWRPQLFEHNMDQWQCPNPRVCGMWIFNYKLNILFCGMFPCQALGAIPAQSQIRATCPSWKVLLLPLLVHFFQFDAQIRSPYFQMNFASTFFWFDAQIHFSS